MMYSLKHIDLGRLESSLLKGCAILSLLVIALQGLRWYLLGNDLWQVDWPIFLQKKANTGLLWNMLLGWGAVAFAIYYRKIEHQLMDKFFLLLWFLWLPNTLYMLTDVKYFGSYEELSLWQDIVFFSCFLILGLSLYFLAVLMVWIKLRFSRIWFLGLTFIMIIGVIIGRVLRWNSWDVFSYPFELLTKLI